MKSGPGEPGANGNCFFVFFFSLMFDRGWTDGSKGHGVLSCWEVGGGRFGVYIESIIIQYSVRSTRVDGFGLSG